MILADTSIWIDHFRDGDAVLSELLLGPRQEILVHPLVVAELALGSLRERATTIRLLQNLPTAPAARLSEVRQLIETYALFGRGIGIVDCQLLASALLLPGLLLWTRNKRLRAVARELKIAAELS